MSNTPWPEKIAALYNAIAPTFIGVDYAKEYDVTVAIAGNFESKGRDMKTNLILSETFQEAQEFAKIMQWAAGQWVFVLTYRSLFSYRGSTLYIVSGGREREDFGAIEGLFIQANIKVIDMEQ